jgi:hypothetical protein
MASVGWFTSRRTAILVVVGMSLLAAACTATPYQYSGNRPVALAVSVNGPGPMSPQGAR